MTSFGKKIIIAGLLALIISCGPFQNIYTNYDRSVDFRVYKTFAWAPDSGVARSNSNDIAALDNDIVRNNAKNYITYCLGQRGYVVNIDSPDLIVELVLLNEKKERIVDYDHYGYSPYYFNHPYYFPYYYPYYRFYTWYGWSYPPPYWDRHISYVQTYIKGTITINVYDRQQKKLVWTGSAEGNIYDPLYIQYDVHPAIDRIMRKFPVRPNHRPRPSDDLYRDRVARANGFHPVFGTFTSQK